MTEAFPNVSCYTIIVFHLLLVHNDATNHTRNKPARWLRFNPWSPHYFPFLSKYRNICADQGWFGQPSLVRIRAETIVSEARRQTRLWSWRCECQSITHPWRVIHSHVHVYVCWPCNLFYGARPYGACRVLCEYSWPVGHSFADRRAHTAESASLSPRCYPHRLSVIIFHSPGQ